jgi:small subunit ribosomal protein S9
MLLVQSTNKELKTKTLTILIMGVIHRKKKTAVARVYVSEGTGVITVNKRICNLFPTATLQYKVMQPMSMTENATKLT